MNSDREVDGVPSPEEHELDPFSSESRELLAKCAYHRDLGEISAAKREHDLSDEAIYFINWSGLSEERKRPYRAAVAECMEAVIQAFGLRSAGDP